jgi:hypothetical protein
MPWVAYVHASDFVIPMIACFETTYGTARGAPLIPSTDARLTMDPRTLNFNGNSDDGVPVSELLF